MSIRRAIAGFMAGWRSAPIEPEPIKEDVAPDPWANINMLSYVDQERGNAPRYDAGAMMRPPKPIKGTLPEGMAMDSVPATIAAVSSWAAESVFHEGQAFLGYQYLAELAQRAEYRRMSEIRAEHATRKWITLHGPDEERIKQIEAEFKRLGVKEHFRAALEKDGLMGRCHIFLDFDDFNRPDELGTPLPLDKGKISPKRPLKRLRIVEAMWCYPGTYETTNPLAPGFYKPDHWYVYGMTVHSDRLLTLVGREVPDMLKPSYAFGGLSLSQMAKPYVDNWLRTRQSVSDLVSAFSQMVLKTNMGSALSGVIAAAQNLFARVDLFNRTRSNRGTMVIDKGSEELTNVTTPLSGLNDLQASSQEHMAAVSGIPLVIFLGVTPSGLNASSDGEVRSFYADIKSSEQEKTCQPHVQKLLEVVQLSLFGEIDPEVSFKFDDLWEVSDKENADIGKVEAETQAIYVSMGAFSNEEVREHEVNREGGLFQGVKGPAPEPEDGQADETEDGDGAGQ